MLVVQKNSSRPENQEPPVSAQRIYSVTSSKPEDPPKKLVALEDSNNKKEDEDVFFDADALKTTRKTFFSPGEALSWCLF